MKNNDISIDNLTPLQKRICDELWACDTQEDILIYISGLPKKIQPTAITMMNMILYELMEQDEIDTTVAQEYLKEFML